ncbi:MAG: SLBB domain-containing protein [Bdellovibrionales bacterium]
MRPLRKIILAALLIASAPAFAQSPAVAPWSDVTGEVRNYKNFRSLQIDPALANPTTRMDQIKNYDQNTPRTNQQNPSIQPPVQNFQPYQTRTSTEDEQSAIEAMYASRIAQPLEQFGYDLFGIPNQDTQNTLNSVAQSTSPSAAVQESFILNGGDELNIVFTGQRQSNARYKINNNGNLIIPDIPPIPAAGRTIGQVRISIESAARQLHNTDAYVSLSSVRQINALVIGNVKRPGRKTLTVFHTVLDALMESGGIDKTGSLRQIKLIRDGRSTFIDLYALLLHGQSAVDLRLRDGDRIIVPSIGPTVAVSGEVKRPAIFEILPRRRGMYHQSAKNSEALTLNEMLELSGGLMAPGKNRTLKLGLTNTGEEIVEDINDPFKPTFNDGSILIVSKGSAKREGMVELIGHTRRPGLYAVSDYKNLQSLLTSNSILGEDIYPLIGVIERYDEDQLTNTFIDFPIRLVIKNKFDQSLKDGDTIHLFSNAHIENLTNTENNEEPQAYGSASQDNNNDIIDDPMLRAFLMERSAFIRGAIRNAGAFPVAQGVTLDSVIAVAGGLSLEANTKNVEVTSSNFEHKDQNTDHKHRKHINLNETPAEDIIIGPGATIRFNQKFEKIKDNSVLIMGEVESPGRYDLIPGDRVSDLIERAGGLNSNAYPYGSIFSRYSERRAEEARFRAQSRTIKQAIAVALEQNNEKVNAGKIAESRALASELEQARGVGRITIESDPNILKTKPELDLLLQPDDRLYIPKRDLTVRVHGEILSPASLQFRDGKAPLDYIHEAGGFTFHADKDRAFVLFPDGSAQPLQVSSWNYNPIFIPPGSTIVIPRDPKPFDFIQSAKDISQILSNLAVTAIFIDDVVEGGN